MTDPKDQAPPASETTVAKKDSFDLRKIDGPDFLPVKLTTFNEAMQFAKILVETKFLPESIKTPGQCVAIMLQGQELGIPPMTALQEIYVVKGKPSSSAKLMLGMFLRAGGRHKVIRADKEHTEIEFTHPNGGPPYVSVFTWDMAKQSNLTNGTNYKNWPQDMVWARCVSRGLRRCAPDIIGNLYTPDEMGATIDNRGKVIEVKAEVVPAPAGPVDLEAPMTAKVDGEETGPTAEKPPEAAEGPSPEEHAAQAAGDGQPSAQKPKEAEKPAAKTQAPQASATPAAGDPLFE